MHPSDEIGQLEARRKLSPQMAMESQPRLTVQTITTQQQNQTLQIQSNSMETLTVL
jgi:hypothetical protein